MTDSELDQALAALHNSHDLLTKTLDSLDDEQVREPSYHSWTIAQVASHLGSQAEVFTMFLDAGANGTEPPGVDGFRPVWDRWDAKSPADQARDVAAANQAFLDRVEALDDEARRSWRLDLFGSESDLAGLVRMKLGEHAVHSWDILVALDPTATLPDDAVAEIVSNLPGLVSRAAKPEGVEQSIAVVTTRPDLTYRLDLTGDAAELTESSEARGEATLTLPGEALVRLCYGRLDAEHTPAEVQAEGVDLDALRRAFPGF